ncbi:IclR family transcriptional regulator [Microtetraspora sp. NBRC 13810]|uniref:IclR family transcriptional regulator n=1 Tax=Microtetraspora sp. NBRC 13810 TaxID=3030990 RepID=UPI0024A3249C|nr:IclR family transcriptional regulator [Microtetraspora sp. NBRC 13810]GLW11114.1 IclR family transcriptional regulator [Microtetraspora sp. NBRC 13810]
MSDQLPPYAIGSVDKAMLILLMIRDRGEVRVTDVSDELGVARSTAHRLLLTLAHRGFVAQDRVSRAYRAGRVVVEIGLSAVGELDVRRKARRHMERLAAELHETVNLIVLEGNGSRFIDGVEGDRPLRVSSRTGTLLPAHSTSGGKVLLAELADEEALALFPDGLTRVTDRTITDPDALSAELRSVRDLGYGVNHEESAAGLDAVAVCVRDHMGRALAALAVSLPHQRMTQGNLHMMLPALRATAEAISQDL